MPLALFTIKTNCRGFPSILHLYPHLEYFTGQGRIHERYWEFLRKETNQLPPSLFRSIFVAFEQRHCFEYTKATSHLHINLLSLSLPNLNTPWKSPNADSPISPSHSNKEEEDIELYKHHRLPETAMEVLRCSCLKEWRLRKISLSWDLSFFLSLEDKEQLQRCRGFSRSVGRLARASDENHLQLRS